MHTLEHLLPVQSQLGEGPRWHPLEQSLYWVDIEGQLIHRFHPASGQHTSWEIGVPVGCLAFRQQGGFVLATSRGFQFWSPGEPLRAIHDPEDSKAGARFNDGAVDAAGRFWAGTLCEGASSALYRLDTALNVSRMIENVTISNGIGWSPDGHTLYYTDTLRLTIAAYDFDLDSGAISNRRVFVSTEGEEGVPDGLAVDAEGCVWSARWGGWKIVRYAPTGEKLAEIELPVQQPTSCAFGGKDFQDLYITSAWTELSVKARSLQPHAGDLFRIRVDTPGLPVHFFQA